MSVKEKFEKYLNIAYRPAKAGIGYDEESSTEGLTKKIIEGLGAVLILYASYSELTDKILKTFSLAQGDSASIIGRMITCLFGLFVCMHIVFNRKSGRPTTFAYSKLQRLLANLTVPLIIVSLGMTAWQFLHERPVSLGQNDSYFDLSTSDCARKFEPGEDPSASRTYVCQINVPKEAQNSFKDLKVFVTTARDYVLKEVVPLPKENKPIKQGQEPLKVGGFGNLRWEWVFPEFDLNNGWMLKVTVGSANRNRGLNDEAPLKATVYLYK